MAFFSPIRDIARRLRALEPPPANYVYMIGYECWGVAMFGPGQAESNGAAQATGPHGAARQGLGPSASSPLTGHPSR